MEALIETTIATIMDALATMFTNLGNILLPPIVAFVIGFILTKGSFVLATLGTIAFIYFR